MDVTNISSSEIVQYLKFTLQFQFSSRFSVYSMGRLSVLSEGEEQLLVTWIMTVSKNEFLIGIWSSSLFV
jgi:hypothetical protein